MTMNGATSSAGPLWSPPPNAATSSLPPRLHPPLPHALRAPRPGPFFVREIYKNGFLKRLPHNERKSSALAKLMRTDRYWAVFSVHDDTFPFLELWNEPAEVASKPPQLVFPLAVCQHISPSIVPADNEWSFVVNFETVAIRFSCNSRQVMEEWVDCIRMKLGEMGILNPKGNLYTKVPLATGRNPMSPLPEPPPPPRRTDQPRTRTSIVDASDETNQTFTTSIYLNQTPPTLQRPVPETKGSANSAAEGCGDTKQRQQSETAAIPVRAGNHRRQAPPSVDSCSPVKTTVFLNQDGGGRHVTVIPINKNGDGGKNVEESQYEEPKPAKTSGGGGSRKRQQSPPRAPSARQSEPLPPPPPPTDRRPRRSTDRKKSQRSSSLGPLLDDVARPGPSGRDRREAATNMLAQQSRVTNTNSLESIDSNPRQAVAKRDSRAAMRPLRATSGHGVSRRPLQQVPSDSSAAAHSLPAPPPPPPPHHGPLSAPPHPPHIPLPGLTCLLLPSFSPAAATGETTLREQVVRLRQEIMHPSGVRLTLRKRDCQGSMALVEFFGCLWVAGWKQREFPVLYNAFQVGDQILTVAGVAVRTVSEFNKLVKHKVPGALPSQPASAGGERPPTNLEMMPHVEVVVRRLPFAQVFYVKREIDGQPLGIVLNNVTAEVKEIVPGSPAALNGMTAKIRSFNDSSVLVPWCMTGINGRPLNLFAKEGEIMDSLQAVGRDISVTLQPADIVAKLRKNLKSVRNHKEFLLS